MDDRREVPIGLAHTDVGELLRLFEDCIRVDCWLQSTEFLFDVIDCAFNLDVSDDKEDDIVRSIVQSMIQQHIFPGPSSNQILLPNRKSF